MNSIVATAGNPDQDAQQRAYAHIKRLILTAECRPGQKLRAQELAGALGLSRTPIREALGRLANEGLVEQAGWGFTVRRLTLQDVREVFEVRLVLELEAARLAVANLSDASAERLEQMLGEAEQRFKAGQTEEYLRRARRFHYAIAQVGGNRLLLGMLESINDRIERIGNILVQRVSTRAAEVMQENRAILNALKLRNAKQLDEAIRRHVERARALILADAVDFDRDLMGGMTD
jgi:DNA-binding GntR family transcriptional regulator